MKKLLVPLVFFLLVFSISTVSHAFISRNNDHLSFDTALLLQNRKVEVTTKDIKAMLRSGKHEKQYVTVILNSKRDTELSNFLNSAKTKATGTTSDRVISIGENARYVAVEVPTGQEVQAFLTQLNARSDVLLAEPAYIRTLFDWNPDDPYFTNTPATAYWQWQLQNRTDTRYSLQMPRAWQVMENKLGTANRGGTATTVIAVLDTGYSFETRTDSVTGWDYSVQTPCADGANLWVNTGEIDFNNIDDDANGFRDDRNGVNIIDYYINPTRSTEDGHPNDDFGHGTHVANVIGAQTNNGACGAGIAFGTSIMPIKIFDHLGQTNSAIIIDALDYAMANGAHILNMSFGGSTYSAAEEAKMNELVSSGLVLIAASGNAGNTTKQYPAAYKNIIAVGASTDRGNRSSYSSYGDWIDFVAPVDLETPIPPLSYTGFPQYSFDCYYDATYLDPWGCLDGDFKPVTNAFEVFSFDLSAGTSFAAPQVVGIAALIKSIRPEYTSRQVKQRLIEGIHGYGPAQKTSPLGYGVVDAYRTVLLVSPADRTGESKPLGSPPFRSGS